MKKVDVKPNMELYHFKSGRVKVTLEVPLLGPWVRVENSKGTKFWTHVNQLKEQPW